MIGIDIIEIARVEEKLSKTGFLDQILTKSEQEYVNQFVNKAERVAGFFCVKEAVKKALGAPEKIGFLEMEISHTKNGKPKFKYLGKRPELLGKKFEISISHSKTVATAVAMVLQGSY